MSKGDHKDYRSLGEILRDARRDRGATLEDISEITKISPRMLSVLEADDLSELASPLYAKSFVKTLAACFRLDEAWLLAKLESAGVSSDSKPIHVPSKTAPSSAPSGPIIPQTQVPPSEPESTTWHIEKVADTTVRRVAPSEGSSGRWLWIAAVVVVVAAAVFWFMTQRGGGDGGAGDSDAIAPVEPAVTSGDAAAVTRLPEPTDSGAATAGESTTEAESATTSGAAATGGDRTESTQGAGAETSGADRADDTEVVVPAGGGEEVVLDRGQEGIPRSGAVKRPAELNTPTPESAAPAGGRPSGEQQGIASVPADAAGDRGEDESSGDAAEESSPGAGATTPADEVPDGAEAGESAPPAVSPGVTEAPEETETQSEMLLEIVASEPVEIWAGADGAPGTHHRLAAGESYTVSGSDHFSLRLSDPAAVEVRLDGEIRRPPRGLSGEWMIYPRRRRN